MSCDTHRLEFHDTIVALNPNAGLDAKALEAIYRAAKAASNRPPEALTADIRAGRGLPEAAQTELARQLQAARPAAPAATVSPLTLAVRAARTQTAARRGDVDAFFTASDPAWKPSSVLQAAGAILADETETLNPRGDFDDHDPDEYMKVLERMCVTAAYDDKEVRQAADAFQFDYGELQAGRSSSFADAGAEDDADYEGRLRGNAESSAKNFVETLMTKAGAARCPECGRWMNPQTGCTGGDHASDMESAGAGGPEAGDDLRTDDPGTPDDVLERFRPGQRLIDPETQEVLTFIGLERGEAGDIRWVEAREKLSGHRVLLNPSYITLQREPGELPISLALEGAGLDPLHDETGLAEEIRYCLYGYPTSKERLRRLRVLWTRLTNGYKYPARSAEALRKRLTQHETWDMGLNPQSPIGKHLNARLTPLVGDDYEARAEAVCKPLADAVENAIQRLSANEGHADYAHDLLGTVDSSEDWGIWTDDAYEAILNGGDVRAAMLTMPLADEAAMADLANDEQPVDWRKLGSDPARRFAALMLNSYPQPGTALADMPAPALLHEVRTPVVRDIRLFADDPEFHALHVQGLQAFEAAEQGRPEAEALGVAWITAAMTAGGATHCPKCGRWQTAERPCRLPHREA